MAIRVRKLAKELNSDPWVVLGLLHAIGFGRFRLPDDMLSDAVVDAVKRAARDGVKPLPVERPEKPEIPAAVSQERPADLMSKLVPGVVPRGKPQVGKKPALAMVKPVDVAPTESAALLPADPDRAEVEQLRTQVRQLEDQLAEVRRELSTTRAALEHAQSTPVEAPALPEPASDGVGWGTPIGDVLHRRGLRGVDEFERAIGVLAQHRLLTDWVGRMRVEPAEPLAKWLRERLILAGQPGEGPVVVVSPDRADRADPADVQRWVSRLGEVFLLHGLRRIVIAGGGPLAQRQLRAMDPRIEIRFFPDTLRRRIDAESDVARTDVVILWGVETDSEADAVYSTSRAAVIRAPAGDVALLVEAVEKALSDEF